jgi:acyl carrier protein phosphodiesterase
MNYLAHAYLSFGHPGIMVGNIISDFVKGKKKFDYPPNIQKGIILHRAIDNYTDVHEAVRSAKEIFRPAYRLYSGAFVDVVFDHFLATDKDEFTETSLLDFSQQVYLNIEKYSDWLPERFASLFPYMRSQNWLFNYQHRQGIEKSLGGVVRRAKYLSESDTAFNLFESHYQRLAECYRQFWKDLKPFARGEFELLAGKGPGNI